MTERRSFSHTQIYWGLAVSLLVALGAAALIYIHYLRFEPVAERHMPEAARWAARLNVEQAVVYEPFRRHLLPLLELGRHGPGSRLEQFEKETSIELGVDLRELLAVQTEDDGWLVLLGGHFPREGVVQGTMRMLESEGITTRLESSPPRLVHESGLSFGVTAEGVLVLASSEDALLDALGRPEAAPLFAPGAALESFWEPERGGQSASHVHIAPGQSFPVGVTCRDSEQRGITADRCPPPPSESGAGLQLPEEGWSAASTKATPESVVLSRVLTRSEFDGAVSGLAQTLMQWLSDR